MLRPLVILSFAFFTLSACTGIPSGISPVSNFDLEEYRGEWFEMARLDHRFERNLEQVSATYTPIYEKEELSYVKVLNKGFNTEKSEWSEAQGKAKFVGDVNVGHLKVSFFGPFYSSYIVFYLDDDQQNAFVTGASKDYLWWLSRTKNYTENQKATFLKEVKKRGFDIDEIIWVNQSE